MKWFFYVIVLIYMAYRAVYGAKIEPGLVVDEISYEESNFLEVGSRKTVNCKATARNQKLEWKDPSGNVIKRIPANRVFTQEHFVSNAKSGRTSVLALTLTELSVSDTGIYQCESGDLTKNVSICVIKPPEFLDTQQQKVTEAGRSITLSCQANGDPEPNISWLRNDEELNEETKESKYRVNRKYNSKGYESLLTITSVEPEDAGLYICAAVQESPLLDTCIHITAMNVTLLVNHAPAFEDGTSTKFVYGKSNHIVNVKCSASGWPKPTYRWFKDLGGNSLYEFDKNKIIFDDDGAMLPITAGPTTFGKSYKCKASNSHGEADKIFTLLEMERPKKASKLTFVSSSDTFIILSVSWDDKVEFPIDNFEVQYLKTEQTKGRQPKEQEWSKILPLNEEFNTSIADGETEETSYVILIDDLDAETEYWVRIRAVNEEGEAYWSSPVRVSTVKAESEVTEVDETEAKTPEEDRVVASEASDGTFYGIFFAGGILVIAVVCMVAMRWV